MPCAGPESPSWAIVLLWAVLILAAVFAPLILVIDLGTYRLVGNTAEVVSALFCMVCCLYACRYLADRIILPLAAFAFFGYALANIFWYLYSITLGRASVSTSVAEIGFFCFFLFFLAAIAIEFTPEPIPAHLPVLLLLGLFILPLILIWGSCAHQPLHLALAAIRFLLIEQLVVAMIRYQVFRYPLLCAGLALFCAGELVYAFRETLVANSPAVFLPGSSLTVYDLFSIAGPIIICSFALIMLGLLAYIRTAPPGGLPPDGAQEIPA
jgi:hypothetical protein